MTAYIIASYDIVDPKGYEGYVPGVVPLLKKHGAEIIAAVAKRDGYVELCE